MNDSQADFPPLPHRGGTLDRALALVEFLRERCPWDAAQTPHSLRRHLLEEAAGITGLHSRRHEAELRLKAAETNLVRLDDVLVTLPANDLSPERNLEQRENEQRVRRALDALTPEQREAILLSRYQGLSYAEIAQIAGCSEGAVKTRVFRAMETLKKVLTGQAGGGDRCLNAIS